MGDEAKPLRILFAIALGLLALLAPTGLQPKTQAVFAVTAFIAAMWLTEAMPLHATALLVPPLLIVLAGITPKEAFTPFFDPTIALLFGGFVLARAVCKHGVDELFGKAIIGIAGAGTGAYLLAAMLVTCFISFWISNTATAAIMIPIALVAVRNTGLKPLKSSYGKAVVLGVAYAASIGGMATIVGTPPNGVVVSNLAKAGVPVSFFDWSYMALPFVAVFIALAWFLLMKIFRPEIARLRPDGKKAEMTRERKLVLGIGALTVLLWATGPLHGIHDSAIAMVPVALLYLFRLLDTKDITLIEWAALLMIGGGLSLGAAMDSSGLGAAAGGLFGGMLSGQPYAIVLFLTVMFAVFMTLSASNTATAALIIPVIIPLSHALGFPARSLAMAGGLGTSLDFTFPIGTPPTAIAYSTGFVRMKDLILAGILTTLLGALLLTGAALLYW